MKNFDSAHKSGILVANKTSLSGENSEISIYKTYQSASGVRLSTNGILFCGMITGRKIMRMSNHDKTYSKIEFLPHESFVIAPSNTIEIDLPDATLDTPTTCLTIEISKNKVNKISSQINETLPLFELASQWQTRSPILHTRHSTETQQLLVRIGRLFTENHPDRNTLLDLSISELIIRMLRHKTREFLLAYCNNDPEFNSLMAALDWINSTLSKPLDIDQLCRHAGMSRSKLYNQFKKNINCSPVELQQQLRLKLAAERLSSGENITAISYDLGFNSQSHFCQRFRKFFGCTATEYKSQTS
ncbi:MAG: AraC family transcriptional regulator N-terminal domain-containing protein [Methylococcales bacterium]